MNLIITDINDLSNYIKNFGLLTISNREANDTTNQFLRNTSINYNNNGNSINHFNYNNNNTSQYQQQQQQQQQQPRPRQTWNRNAESLSDILPNYNQSPRNRPSQSSERPIFGGGGGGGFGATQVNNNNNNNQNNRRAQVASPVGFNVNFFA